ncbi:Tyrosine-protein phosphatase non-receptor type 2 [Coemansia spiralis]|uniref:Tyrosine-protein phosphatase non-receptor type 2 n=2 Tax=Coemansia TaxID=4863 RepID=A0A9W8L0H0_9FUNG|nr:Tyrosine-protein phosphatase non-receptor type 2 [Coemansia umbellata]KAJ2623153.1 Tyrosine-protein phosphatase non-receptor type 2 [Coemansia sp. RSA 1358]KAJ2680031.1 Tyrosine-protein phosphatase non-receptor type 2 [Coemansia spiralis]
MEPKSFKQLLQESEQPLEQQRIGNSFEQTDNKDWERMERELERVDKNKCSAISASQCQANRELNRYPSILPYNYNRVLLAEGKNNYINATHIKLPDKLSKTRYIATQGPLDHTIGDFWQMIWEQKTQSIVMLANPVERGQRKCAIYWPSVSGEPVTSRLNNGDISVAVTLLSENQLDSGYPSTVVRTLMLEHKQYSGGSRTVRQLHYTEWPDHGVPLSPVPLLRVLQELNSGKQNAIDDAPVVVHCSAGVGRTGTFIIMDAARRYFTTHNDYLGDFIIESFKSLREQRTLMVQTQAQLMFCYQAIAHMLNSC